MLCCLGLVAGFAAGAALGGPWTFLAPIAGFGLARAGSSSTNATILVYYF